MPCAGPCVRRAGPSVQSHDRGADDRTLTPTRILAMIFSQAVNVTGLFLAKLDGSAKGGIVVGIRDQLDIPVKFVGLGETIEAIASFDPQAFVDAMFEGL